MLMESAYFASFCNNMPVLLPAACDVSLCIKHQNRLHGHNTWHQSCMDVVQVLTMASGRGQAGTTLMLDMLQAAVKAPEQKTGFLASVTKPFTAWLSPKPAAKPQQPSPGELVKLVATATSQC